MERIADQKRFEEEQRAARAGERERERDNFASAEKDSSLHRHHGGGEAGDGGGDSSSPAADSGGRRPKGLVWEVNVNWAYLSLNSLVLLLAPMVWDFCVHDQYPLIC